jgi:hypothetical protein
VAYLDLLAEKAQPEGNQLVMALEMGHLSIEPGWCANGERGGRPRGFRLYYLPVSRPP